MSTGGPGQGGDHGGPLPKGSMTTPGICGCHEHLRVALGHRGSLRSSAKGIRDCSRDLWLSGASPGGPGPWGDRGGPLLKDAFLFPRPQPEYPTHVGSWVILINTVLSPVQMADDL